jgi:hypothetical protein
LQGRHKGQLRASREDILDRAGIFLRVVTVGCCGGAQNRRE